MHNPKAKKGLAGWSMPALVGAFLDKRKAAAVLKSDMLTIEAELLRRIPPGKKAAGLKHRVSVYYSADDIRLAQVGRLAEALTSNVDESKLAALARLCPELLDCRAIIKERVSKLVVVTP